MFETFCHCSLSTPSLCCSVLLPPLWALLSCLPFFLVESFFFTLPPIEGLRPEGVVHCTDCKAPEAMWFATLVYTEKLKSSSRSLGKYRLAFIFTCFFSIACRVHLDTEAGKKEHQIFFQRFDRSDTGPHCFPDISAGNWGRLSGSLQPNLQPNRSYMWNNTTLLGQSFYPGVITSFCLFV